MNLDLEITHGHPHQELKNVKVIWGQGQGSQNLDHETLNLDPETTNQDPETTNQDLEITNLDPEIT